MSNRIGRNPFEVNDIKPLCGIGDIYEHKDSTLGWGLYKYVKFEDAVTYKRGMLVSYTPSTPLGTRVTVDCSEAVETTALWPAGVCCAIMTENYYGFIQVAGVALVIGDGAVAAGDRVIKDPSVDTGIADTVAADEEDGLAFGQALSTDDTANDPLATSAMFYCVLTGII